MTARGLQGLDAQDHERWRLGCKNQLAPVGLHAGNLCWAPEIEGSTFLQQNDDDEQFFNENAFYVKLSGRFLGPKTKVT